MCKGVDNVKKVLIRLCDFLEKKLYDAPTVQELAKSLDRTRYRLYEAKSEIDYLQSIIKQIMSERQTWQNRKNMIKCEVHNGKNIF